MLSLSGILLRRLATATRLSHTSVTASPESLLLSDSAVQRLQKILGDQVTPRVRHSWSSVLHSRVGYGCLWRAEDAPGSSTSWTWRRTARPGRRTSWWRGTGLGWWWIRPLWSISRLDQPRPCLSIKTCFHSGLHHRLPRGVDQGWVQDHLQPPGRGRVQLWGEF